MGFYKLDDIEEIKAEHDARAELEDDFVIKTLKNLSAKIEAQIEAHQATRAPGDLIRQLFGRRRGQTQVDKELIEQDKIIDAELLYFINAGNEMIEIFKNVEFMMSATIGSFNNMLKIEDRVREIAPTISEHWSAVDKYFDEIEREYHKYVVPAAEKNALINDAIEYTRFVQGQAEAEMKYDPEEILEFLAQNQ